jgi:mutual gliding-motility protein MglA
VVVVSYSGKEINAKLVYYGAGLCGKTTNLEAIYEAVPDTSRGKMVSMKTQSDRTLFFDLLPLDLGEIMGFKTRFLLYTVPGQVFYNATRKLVLKGSDAIVFVADSEVGKMEENKESLANLRANLAEYGLTLDSIPWVIQYNKRDLPNVYSVDELNAELNPTGVPWFEAVASEGRGVFETFRGVSHLLMEKVTKDLRRSPSSSSRPVSTPVAEEPVIAKSPVFAPSPVPPPPAPVQAIRHEVQATPEPILNDSDRVDYGTEIELAPPVHAVESTPVEPALPETLAVPSSFHTPTPAPVESTTESVTTPAVASEAIRSIPLPRPSSSFARPEVPAHVAHTTATVSETAPAPMPSFTVEPTSLATPTPVMEPTPMAVVEPAPTPVVEPTPMAVVEPAPTMVVEPTPMAVVESAPTMVVEPTPMAVVESTPTMVVEPTPMTVVESTPTPTVATTPTTVTSNVVEVRQIVVPVRVQAGAQYEIVIKLEVDPQV